MSTPLLTDAGLETWLVFHRRVDLQDFAAFPLMDDDDGRALLVRCPHLEVLGGCCRSDARPVEAIARACIPRMVSA